MKIELFCKVVDNYGDAGVCGRLARQLAFEHGFSVRLWIDQPEALAKLQIFTTASFGHEGEVEICLWPEPFDLPADFSPVVIEAFACGTPPEVQMALQHATHPLWLNLEYLSAEDWVDGAHLTPSTQPRSGLVQTFFFPGYTRLTGGLLRERDLLARRKAFNWQSWWQQTLGPVPPDNALKISLFGYPAAPLAGLLEALNAYPAPVWLLVPEGLYPELPNLPGGQVTLQRFRFLPQAAYDGLLWSCDLNFVRGEDSWSRAQFAGKPLIWQAYPQSEAAHEAKIAAFLARYSVNLPKNDAEKLALAHAVWNLSSPDTGRVWPDLLASLPTLLPHAQLWADELASQPDLASQLAAWIKKKRM